MRIIPKKQTYKLTASSIDSVSSDFRDFLESLGTQRKNLVISRIALEDYCLIFRNISAKKRNSHIPRALSWEGRISTFRFRAKNLSR